MRPGSGLAAVMVQVSKRFTLQQKIFPILRAQTTVPSLFKEGRREAIFIAIDHCFFIVVFGGFEALTGFGRFTGLLGGGGQRGANSETGRFWAVFLCLLSWIDAY